MAWSKELKTPFTLDDGRKLTTLSDVRVWMLDLPDHRRRNPHWQSTAEILLAARGGSADMDELTGAVAARPGSRRRALAATAPALMPSVPARRLGTWIE
jgi:hypothetical protein